MVSEWPVSPDLMRDFLHSFVKRLEGSNGSYYTIVTIYYLWQLFLSAPVLTNYAKLEIPDSPSEVPPLAAHIAETLWRSGG